MTATADVLVRLGLNRSAYDRGMKEAEDRLRDVATTVGTVGLAAVTAIGALSVRAASEFETAFAGVRKTVDATEEEFQQIRQEFRRLSFEIPVATTALLGIGEVAGQLGVEKEHLTDFTRVMAALGVTTNLSSEEAATALARLANVTQLPQTEFERLGSTVVALGNNLATTEAEIVEMGLRLAGAGHQVGMSQSQILGLAGALSSVGINAEAGGTAFSTAMIRIAREVTTGSDKVQMFASVAGMSVEEFTRLFQEDAASAIVLFVEGLGRMSDSGQNVFTVLEDLGLSEIRLRDALLRASGAGDLMRRSIELGSVAWRENTALTTEANVRYGTAAAQAQLMRNKLNDAATTIGSSLLPAVVTLMGGVAGLALAFGSLNPVVQASILAFAGLSSAALLFLGSVPKISAGIAALTVALTGETAAKIANAAATGAATVALNLMYPSVLASTAAAGAHALVTGVATVATWAWNAALLAMNVLLSPVTLTIGAVVAVGALLAAGLWHLNERTGILTAALEWLKGAFTVVADVVKGAVVAAIHALTGAVRSAAEWIGDKLGPALDVVTGAWGWFKEGVTGAWEAVRGGEPAVAASTERLVMLEGQLVTTSDALRRFHDIERNVERQAGATTEAVQKQTTYTREKGETTEEFRERLIAAGVAEEELKQHLEDTTESLTVQADGTIQGAEAMRGLGAAAREAVTGLDLLRAAEENLARVTAHRQFVQSGGAGGADSARTFTLQGSGGRTFNALMTQSGLFNVLDESSGQVHAGLTTGRLAALLGVSEDEARAMIQDALARLLQGGGGSGSGGSGGGSGGSGGGGGSQPPRAEWDRLAVVNFGGGSHAIMSTGQWGTYHVSFPGTSQARTLTTQQVWEQVISKGGYSSLDQFRQAFNLPQFREGGIVPRGRPRLGFFEGEEAEAVIPLSRLREFLPGGGGGGATVVIHNLNVRDGRDFDDHLAVWGVKRRMA